jgi:hypothetical protein
LVLRLPEEVPEAQFASWGKTASKAVRRSSRYVRNSSSTIIISNKRCSTLRLENNSNIRIKCYTLALVSFCIMREILALCFALDICRFSKGTRQQLATYQSYSMDHPQALPNSATWRSDDAPRHQLLPNEEIGFQFVVQLGLSMSFIKTVDWKHCAILSTAIVRSLINCSILGHSRCNCRFRVTANSLGCFRVELWKCEILDSSERLVVWYFGLWVRTQLNPCQCNYFAVLEKCYYYSRNLVAANRGEDDGRRHLSASHREPQPIAPVGRICIRDLLFLVGVLTMAMSRSRHRQKWAVMEHSSRGRGREEGWEGVDSLTCGSYCFSFLFEYQVEPTYFVFTF